LAKRQHTPDIIEEIDSAADRMAEWIAENRWLVIGVLALVLGAALAWGGYDSYYRSREEAASNALAKTRSAYFTALGATPGAIEEPVLANPKAALAIQQDFVERFAEVSDAHDGTVAGTLALFEVARLLDKLERGDESAALWDRALDAASGNPGLRGLLDQRRAGEFERDGKWDQAASAHESAGNIVEYPLRYWALVDAARCAAEGGEGERALALYERVEHEAPDLTLPPHLRAQYRELQASVGT
jgi:predicted negative regulator of RcsB-dependent stress response